MKNAVFYHSTLIKATDLEKSTVYMYDKLSTDFAEIYKHFITFSLYH